MLFNDFETTDRRKKLLVPMGVMKNLLHPDEPKVSTGQKSNAESSLSRHGSLLQVTSPSFAACIPLVSSSLVS
jgi:hypothetical protein